MAGSDLGVVFEMSADPSQATAAIQEFSGQADQATTILQEAIDNLTASIGEMNTSLTASREKHDQAAVAARQNALEHTEALHAVRGLGEEVGIHMPRFGCRIAGISTRQ